jgi:hypothetical protein
MMVAWSPPNCSRAVFAHDVGHRGLRSGDQRPQCIHEAAFGLVLNRFGQVIPAKGQREIDGMSHVRSAIPILYVQQRQSVTSI